MKRLSGFSVIAAVALVAVVAAPAMADPSAEPVGQYAGHLYLDLATEQSWWDTGGFGPRLPGDVYNNTNPPAAANFGFSSTDLTSIWGDRVTTTGTGQLQENDFTVF